MKVFFMMGFKKFLSCYVIVLMYIICYLVFEIFIVYYFFLCIYIDDIKVYFLLLMLFSYIKVNKYICIYILI